MFCDFILIILQLFVYILFIFFRLVCSAKKKNYKDSWWKLKHFKKILIGDLKWFRIFCRNICQCMNSKIMKILLAKNPNSLWKLVKLVIELLCVKSRWEIWQKNETCDNSIFFGINSGISFMMIYSKVLSLVFYDNFL